MWVNKLKNKDMKYKMVKLNEREIAMIKFLVSSTYANEYSPMSVRKSLLKKINN